MVLPPWNFVLNSGLRNLTTARRPSRERDINSNNGRSVVDSTILATADVARAVYSRRRSLTVYIALDSRLCVQHDGRLGVSE